MTYLGLAVVFLLPCVAASIVASIVIGRGPRGRWWLVTAATLATLLGLTLVFDSLMIWADLFRYDDAHLVGLMLGLAPVEDFAWPVAAALLLPALWEILGRRRPRPQEGQR